MRISTDDFLDQFDPSQCEEFSGRMMSASLLADWIELMALRTEMKPWADVIDIIANATGRNTFSSSMIGGEFSQVEKYPIGQTLRNIIEERISALGPLYPFAFNALNQLEVSKKIKLADNSYIVLLGISLLHGWSDDSAIFKCYTNLFECIVANAFQKSGFDSGVVGTGQDEGGFAKKLCAWGEKLRIHVDPNAAVHSIHAKDEKVDVIAGKPFRDDRKGELFFLIQATCGKRENWCSKLSCIPASKWQAYLMENVRPFCYIAIPYHLSKEAAEELVIQRPDGSFLDRIRLVKMIGSELAFADESDQILHEEIQGHLASTLGLTF